MIVKYDEKRGEPRAILQAKTIAKANSEVTGDCVNCYRCVQVCPTGIDIRRGLQMECIACTACIDACDDVMTKIKKPVGLIRYDSLTGNSKKKYNFSYRAAIYFSLALTATILLITSLALIQPIDVDILRAKDTPYSQQVIEDGSSIIINHFKFEISNQSELKYNLVFGAKSGEGLNEIKLIIAQKPLTVKQGQRVAAEVFIRFPKNILANGQRQITVVIKNSNKDAEIDSKTTSTTKANSNFEIEKEVTLVGPLS